jgi:protein ImuA
MQLISCHDDRLLTLESADLGADSRRSFRTGLAALDATAPTGAFALGAIHELLSQPSNPRPLFIATLLARAALEGGGALPDSSDSNAATKDQPRSAIIWCDPLNEVYPPALAAQGLSLRQVFLLHPRVADQTWAVAECLRCKGVGAVVAALPRLSRIEARRLQLAAEQGGGAGIFLRPADATVYAASTRWLITPVLAQRSAQRWNIQLIHGHGGRLGHHVTLEHNRENHSVRALDPMADRPLHPATPKRVTKAS